MDDFKAPDVVTTLKNKELNFTFQVVAYRRLSEKEMHSALRIWMRQRGLSKIPRNRVGKLVLTVGLDE